MFTRIFLTIIIFITGQTAQAQIQPVVDACREITAAMKAGGNTSQLRNAGKKLRALKTSDFTVLNLKKGNELSIDDHLFFDEEFIDSLVVNREVTKFARRFARKRVNRSTTTDGSIRLSTKALKAGATASWLTFNSATAEYAIVAEPGGLFTMSITDPSGKKVYYAETVKNKQGDEVRQVKISLPNKRTPLLITISNRGKTNASFALIGN